MLEKLLKLLGENGQWNDEELEIVRGILCLAGLILGFFFMGIAGENPDKTVNFLINLFLFLLVAIGFIALAYCIYVSFKDENH